MNILIIGAGQLGSRHLQGLALLNQSLNIYLVDPSQQALKKCEERFREVDKFYNKNLYFYEKIVNLPQKVELAIISTTSKHRLSSLKLLMEQCSVKYLILEKFLFPDYEEYKKAEKIINSSDTLTYVNCSRRLLKGYQSLKEQLLGLKLEVKVIGSNWNLASNSIHFVDLFYYLNGGKDIEFNYESSNLTAVDSKHIGYTEFFGHIKAEATNASTLELTCENIGVQNLVLEIKTNDRTYIIDEMQGTIEFNGEKQPFQMLYQSQMTNIVFEKLVFNGECDLVGFEESAKMHVKLLKLFNEYSRIREGIVT